MARVTGLPRGSEKHTELAYKGTMRAAPTELAYKGTMHMKKPDASRVPKDDGRRGSESSSRSEGGEAA